jgi:hypothetical protein
VDFAAIVATELARRPEDVDEPGRRDGCHSSLANLVVSANRFRKATQDKSVARFCAGGNCLDSILLSRKEVFSDAQLWEQRQFQPQTRPIALGRFFA